MAVSIPKWFDWNAYLNNKLATMPSGTTMPSLVSAMDKAGFVGEEGSYRHFLQFGHAENVSPSAGFDANQYFTFKAAQTYHSGNVSAVTAAEAATIKQLIADAGMDAWTHYQKYGTVEMINASNSFDTAAYLQAKSVAMGGSMSAAQVADAIQKAGMNAYEHYMQFKGGAGEVEATATYVVDPSKQASNSGQTFTLTKSVQSLTGTSGNDTFIAGDEGGAATLNAGDAINGGAGDDTLKIFNSGAANNSGAFANAVISSVENVEFTSVTTNTLNVSANADVKKVTLVNGEDGVVSLKVAQTAGLSGGINTKAAATFTFTDATGGADSANLALNAADLVTNGNNGLTIGAIETLNIAATGTNLLGTTTLAQTTKLVITGGGAVSTTLASGLAKTIDGSAATGNLTIDNKAAAAAVQSVKTGSGNDTYTTKYADLTLDDSIDLGAGTDSLRFSDSATFNTTATKERLTKVSNVEQLGVQGAATLTVDGDFVTQTSYYAGGTGADVALTNLANNADVTFSAGVIDASTVGMKLGSNTLNVNLAGSMTTAADLTAGLTVTGSSTINVKSTGTDGVANNVLALTAPDNQSVVVTGSQNLTLVAANAPSTTGFSVDASAFTGKLTVTGTNDADIIKGGSGNDTIDGGVGTAAVLGVKEVFTATFSATTDNDTVTFDGTGAIPLGALSSNIQAAAAYVAGYNAVPGATWVAVDNLNGTVTFTKKLAGAVAPDVTTADFVIGSGGVGADATVTAAVPSTQGVTAANAAGFAADTMTGGAGNDKFIISNALSATPVATDADVVTDFVSGSDTLSFLLITGAGNIAGTSANYAEGTAAVANFTAAVAAADAHFNGTVRYSAQQIGSDTFVFFDQNADGNFTQAGNDFVVKLTGVSLDGIAFADIVA